MRRYRSSPNTARTTHQADQHARPTDFADAVEWQSTLGLLASRQDPLIQNEACRKANRQDYRI